MYINVNDTKYFYNSLKQKFKITSDIYTDWIGYKLFTRGNITDKRLNHKNYILELNTCKEYIDDNIFIYEGKIVKTNIKNKKTILSKNIFVKQLPVLPLNIVYIKMYMRKEKGVNFPLLRIYLL